MLQLYKSQNSFLYSLQVPRSPLCHWPHLQAVHLQGGECRPVRMEGGHGRGCSSSKRVLQAEWNGDRGGSCQSRQTLGYWDFQVGVMLIESAMWPFIVRAYVAHCLKVFGPERCMFGSDWPVCRLAGAEHHQVREQSTPGCDRHQQKCILGCHTSQWCSWSMWSFHRAEENDF